MLSSPEAGVIRAGSALERFRAILNSALDAIVVLDAHGRLVEFNPGAERMLGHDLGAVVGHRLTDIVIPVGLRSEYQKAIEGIGAGTLPSLLDQRLEIIAHRHDGTEFPAEVAIHELPDAEPRQFVAFVRDRTPRAQAWLEVQARERRYANQRRELIDLGARAARNGRSLEDAFRDVTETASRTLGVARVSVWLYNADRSAIRCVDSYDATTGQHAAGEELRSADYPAYFRALAEIEVIAAADACDDPRTMEFAESYLRPQGIASMLDVPIHLGTEVGGVLCHEHVGERREWHSDENTFALAVGGVVSLTIESDERRRAEDSLRKTRDRLEQAVSAGQIGLWDWDPPEQVVHYSREFCRQIGVEPDALGHDLAAWHTRIHPADWQDVKETVESFLANRIVSISLEYRFRHHDGSYRHMLARMARLVDQDGSTVRVTGTHVDMTERALLQAQLLQAQKMESVGHLAGGVAHDFNNILTVINGTAELAMKDLRDEDPLREDLQRIYEAGERAAGLTHQLLAFSRKQLMSPDVLSLNGVVDRMKDMLQRLIGETIEARFHESAELAHVRADRSQIEQVIMNLAVNARDAMPEGGVLTIATGSKDVDGAFAMEHPPLVAGQHVILSITDTGTGMDATTLARIFEPFFTTKLPGRGTGLGLSTVYGIVQQSGGCITVSSRVGEGTEFRIYLPAVQPSVPKPLPVARAQAPTGTATVLLVEDEAILRHLAQRILEGLGYVVLSAKDGMEALVAIEHHKGSLDLLVTDIMLPGIRGVELASRIVALRPDIKVLYTSGYAEDGILPGVNAAAVHFLGKPYTRVQLSAKVREALES